MLSTRMCRSCTRTGGGVAAIATLGMSGTAQAVPTNSPEEWLCGGEDTVIFTAGRNGWFDGSVHYHAVQLSFMSTFTPTGGEPQTETEEKTWADGHGLDDPDGVTCTIHFEETTPEGTFVGDGVVIAAPVRG